MTDSENKYEQRVRQRAEEMAVTVFPDEHKYKGLSQMHYGKWLDCVGRLEGAARLSVQRESEAWREAYKRGWSHASLSFSTRVQTVDEQLQSLGLVPEK